MAQPTKIKTKGTRAGHRPFISVPSGRRRPASRSLRSWMIRAAGVLLPLGILAGFPIAFGVWGAAREAAINALSYGLVPVFLYAGALVVAVRFRAAWMRRYWRVWVGSACGVAVLLSALSVASSASGIVPESSLSGSWGEYLGGGHLALGALKLAALILVSPLLILPDRAPRTYGRLISRASRDIGLGIRWLGIRVRRGTAAGMAAIISLVRSRRTASGSLETPTAPVKMKRGPRLPVKADSGGAAGVMEGRAWPEPEPEPVKPLAAVAEGGWMLPSPRLLSEAESRSVPQVVLQQMAEHIEATLADHRVEVAVEDIRIGPRVVRFGLVPGWIKKYRDSKAGKSKDADMPPIAASRVRVQSILMREKDLALALKTPYLRLEAPVPGEALVGLEVPSPYPRKVALRSAVESDTFKQIASKGGLPVALGEDTGGNVVVADLTDLPHLLIAGATGSGKSVCINATVASLLLTCGPDRLRMLMVDPKRVELTLFNGIPHLIAPVIVDTDEVLVVLRAVQNEMLRRFRLMEDLGVRNIEGYNLKTADPIPYLVVAIDELADLMMAAAYDVEQGLVRLAQLGRATGIHLILATQRPSVNVVTGLLKANVPGRVAFAVASQVDSRVILDSVGAEKLLGKGDMLLLTSDSPKPRRVQGTYVSDRELESLVQFWKSQLGPPVPEIPLDGGQTEKAYDDEDQEDDLLERARDIARRSHQVSTSLLQRRLQIGYQRAASLVDLLQEESLDEASGVFSGEGRWGQ